MDKVQYVTLSTNIAVGLALFLNANISELFSDAHLPQTTTKPDKYNPINLENEF
jgi:hypothetical protein